MNVQTLLTFLLSCFAAVSAQQRVAPGVPPQQYQQAPMHQVPQHMPQQQHMQQAMPQMQQVPVQQQQQLHQVPQQQMHHVPQMQQPQGQAHGHHGQAQILNAANIAHEKQHIQEHLEVPMDTSKMSEQELQFHYFKMHDADNNNKLDGCELIKSLIHWHANGQDGQAAEPEVHTDEELSEMIDPVLQSVDADLDGYVDYSEFKRSKH